MLSVEAPVLGILDITNAEHHAIRALSNSGMRDLSISALRFWYKNINPAPKPEEEETAALRLGSALHCAVLESEEVFDSRYAKALDPSDWPVCLDTVPQIRRWVEDKGGKCKGTSKDDVIASAREHMRAIGEFAPILQDEQARFFAANEGKTILHPDEWDRLAGMAAAINDEPVLKPILRSGRSEVSMVARDSESSVLLKARLDWIADGPHGASLDLKSFTARRGQPIDKAVNDALYYEGHGRQIVFYDMVRRLVTGEKPGDFESVLVYVESELPHEVRIKRLLPKRGGSPNLFWLTAAMDIRRMIRTYEDCMERFGDKPWRDPQEIHTLADEELRQLSYA